jgi:PIN domain nuclease of toxin-antitoxin system
VAAAAASGCVLETSALLAWLWKEPGDSAVQRALTAGGCRLSAVNLAELLAKFSDAGLVVEDGLALVQELELIVLPADAADAAEAARLRASTRSQGLSLGDRACLALARHPSPPPQACRSSVRPFAVGSADGRAVPD